MTKFCGFTILSVYKISKFALSMWFSLQKAINFYIPHLKTQELKLPYP